jgi:hypothetical protein
MKNIEKNQLLKLTPFKQLANRKPYAERMDTILAHIQKAQATDKKELIAALIYKACKYCGISATYRTICYTFAESIFDSHKHEWIGLVEDDERIYLHDNLAFFAPDYDRKLDKYDVNLFQPAEDWFYSFHMVFDDIVSEDLKPAICYGAYRSFSNAEGFFDVDEEFWELLEELENDL